MALYAAERIDDAVELTRSLLFPFDGGLWARLTVVVFVIGIGSGGSFANLGYNGSSTGSAAGSAGSSASHTLDVGSVSIASEVVAAVAAIALVLVAIWLALAWLGATLEFVFVEALSDRSLSIRRGLGRNRGRGFRLFAFRIAVFALSLAVFGAALLAVFWEPITTALDGGAVTISESRLIAGIGALLIVSVLVGVPALVIHWLTTELVVPIMLAQDRGVLGSWRELLSAIRAQWKQFGVYLLVVIGLRIATTIAAGIVLSIVAVVLAIPFLIVGLGLGLGAVAGGAITAPLVVGIVLLVLVFGFVIMLVNAVVHVPIESFHRYFSLLFVGDVAAEFDVLGEIRPPLSDRPETA
ncbi:DUF7544 domain-containing protein [Halapricum desulfuricans]|uniref:Putative membrane protein n=1 Tax=Halapricum desulfuricans TaxID=2841257 RepID=A0A897NNZ4_9EURY|nr:hypothetical protein [Halapricum desulfuricans]QSG14487.1 putative membrane protein [Halapricum desulfuricans]